MVNKTLYRDGTIILWGVFRCHILDPILYTINIYIEQLYNNYRSFMDYIYSNSNYSTRIIQRHKAHVVRNLVARHTGNFPLMVWLPNSLDVIQVKNYGTRESVYFARKILQLKISGRSEHLWRIHDSATVQANLFSSLYSFFIWNFGFFLSFFRINGF